MKARILLVMIGLLVAGAGGKLAYDAYLEHERQQAWETVPLPAECDTCAAHKADVKRLREYKAQRSLLEEQAGPKVE